MHYGLQQIVAPASEPLTISEVRAHLRLPADEYNTLIEGLITTARQFFEEEDDRRLVTQTWKLTLERFPCWTIDVPIRPLQVVNSIKYIDADGVRQTVDPAKYLIDKSSFVPRVTPSYGESWPVARSQNNAVEIEFDCGYGYQRNISSLTAAASAVAGTTTPHGLSVGDVVHFADVVGMTEINGLYGIINAVGDATHLTLDLDSSGFTAYSSGGQIAWGPDLPNPLKQALLLLIGHFYENREDSAVVSSMIQIPMGYKSLIGANRRIHV